MLMMEDKQMDLEWEVCVHTLCISLDHYVSLYPLFGSFHWILSVSFHCVLTCHGIASSRLPYQVSLSPCIFIYTLAGSRLPGAVGSSQEREGDPGEDHAGVSMPPPPPLHRRETRGCPNAPSTPHCIIISLYMASLEAILQGHIVPLYHHVTGHLYMASLACRRRRRPSCGGTIASSRQWRTRPGSRYACWGYMHMNVYMDMYVYTYTHLRQDRRAHICIAHNTYIRTHTRARVYHVGQRQGQRAVRQAAHGAAGVPVPSPPPHYIIIHKLHTVLQTLQGMPTVTPLPTVDSSR